MMGVAVPPAVAEDPCAPTSQPDGVLVALSPSCDYETLTVPTNYYIQGDIKAYDPDPTRRGPSNNPGDCESGVVLKMEVTSNNGVPMKAEGTVKCEGVNVWGLRGELLIVSTGPTVRARIPFTAGTQGLSPFGSSVYNNSSSPLKWESGITAYKGYRASLNYEVKRSIDGNFEGPYYVRTSLFYGKCKT